MAVPLNRAQIMREFGFVIAIVAIIAAVFVPVLRQQREFDLKPGDEVMLQADTVMMSISDRTPECIARAGVAFKVETVHRFSLDHKLFYRLVPMALTDMSHEACHPDDKLLVSDSRLWALDFKLVRK